MQIIIMIGKLQKEFGRGYTGKIREGWIKAAKSKKKEIEEEQITSWQYKGICGLRKIDDLKKYSKQWNAKGEAADQEERGQTVEELKK